MRGFLILWHIAHFWFDNKVTGKSTYLNPKWCGLNVLYFYSPPENEKYQTGVALCNVIAYEDNLYFFWQWVLPKPWASFWSFPQTTRTPLARRYQTRQFNSYKSDISDIGSLQNLICTQHFFAFVSFILFIKGIRGDSTWICTATLHQISFCETLFIVGFFFLILINRSLICKVPYSLRSY